MEALVDRDGNCLLLNVNALQSQPFGRARGCVFAAAASRSEPALTAA